MKVKDILLYFSWIEIIIMNIVCVCACMHLLFRFSVICTNMNLTGWSPPTPTPSLQQIALHHLSLHSIATQRSARWHVFHVWHVLHDVHGSGSRSSLFLFFNQFFSSLAVVSSIRKTGAMVKASHCRQMLFSIWHDASSRSHFHCDCRAPSESIDNPCQALAPPTGAGTAS